MIILDTNVLSALMSWERNPIVVSWANQYRVEDFWTTTINIFELRHGIERVKDPVRREDLNAMYRRVMVGMISGRVLAVDEAAAHAGAALKARREKDGIVQEIRDTLIAGVAVAREMPLATRNIRHFADAGLVLIDPWREAAGT